MKFLLPLLLAAVSITASAQTVSTKVKFDKSDKPALMLYLPYTVEVAEGTILSKLKETGYEPETKTTLLWKQNKVNGFYVFKGVALTGNKSEPVDLYFKVDRRGSKKDSASVMYMLTSKGSENFVSNASEPAIFSAAQKFLNGFTNETASYKHKLDVQAQEETVKKTEKKLEDLNLQITKLQEELNKDKQDQAALQITLENEKKKLEEMKKQ